MPWGSSDIADKLYKQDVVRRKKKTRIQRAVDAGLLEWSKPEPPVGGIPNPYTSTPNFANSGYYVPSPSTLAPSALSNANSPISWSAMADAYGRTYGPSSSGGGNGGGSGGGSGGGGGSATDPSNFANREGFAKNYVGAGDSIIYDDPRILVRDTLKAMGYNPNDGLMDLLGQQAGDLQYLAMLGLGAGPDSANSQTTENYINFANQWAKNMMTPGAAIPSYEQMIQSILDAPEGSAIKAALEGGTPQEQAAMLNNLVQVAATQLTPLMQRALGRTMQDRTDDWLSSKAKGGKDPLANWLQKGGRGLTG